MPPTSRSRRQLGGGFRGTRRPARANRPVIADRGCAARDRPFDELAAGPEHGDLPDPTTHGTPPRARTHLLLARRRLPTDSRIARHFDAKLAKRLAQCQDPGLVAVSERLRDALLSLVPTGRRVLELGCGRGGLLLRLVQAGAARAAGVDLSSASIDEARNRFEQAQ